MSNVALVYIVLTAIKIRVLSYTLCHITGCDSNDIIPTDHRKPCPRGYACLGAEDICVKRPSGKF